MGGKDAGVEGALRVWAGHRHGEPLLEDRRPSLLVGSAHTGSASASHDESGPETQRSQSEP